MLRPAKTPPHLLTLIMLTGASVMSLNMFAPSLAHMAADFDVDYGVMSLAIGGYLAVTAVVQVLVGPLSDRYGRRPLLLGGLAIFALASLVCALTESFTVFLVARICQTGVGAGMALSRAVIRDMFETREAAKKMSLVAFMMAVAPMVGPTIGGFLDSAFGWRASFWAYCGGGAILFAIAWLDLGETHHQRSRSFATQFASYPELFRSRRFWGYATCMGFSVGTFYIFIAGAPLVVKAVFGMTTARLGVFMGTITLGFMLGAGLSTRLNARVSITAMMLAGRVVALVGLGGATVLLAFGIVSVPLFFGAMVLSGIGNGLTTPNASAGALSVRPHLAGTASGVSSAMIVGFGAVLSTLTGAVVSAEQGVWLLPGLMALASLAGLVSALSVLRIDRREGALAKRPGAGA
ncbi:multidrug effflux MFS transporter [Pseudooceanicola aestuarii]|uniref:multidrug effflux MFS transporter n=1 Tax=Pseudooceanicola aestuarii TaxID=2697319 RepID=UPI0019545AA9|nr:multidrug effflux MFS transporter [Pseudooceanicola aestuarii]